MQWWAWIAVGAILLGSELTFVNAQFYLVFIGSAALVVGLMDLAGLHAPDWLQWTSFAVLATVSMVAFRRRVYERMRGHLPAVSAVPKGEVVIMPTVLRPGETCRLEYRGSSWSAVNAGQSVIDVGARARVQRVDGLTLVVHGE
jgi:membrane protein implicated in regulation of membrane protease activity